MSASKGKDSETLALISPIASQNNNENLIRTKQQKVQKHIQDGENRICKNNYWLFQDLSSPRPAPTPALIS